MDCRSLLRVLWVVVALMRPVDGVCQGLYPSVGETRREFEALCRRLRESDNPYYGVGLVDKARLKVEEQVTDPLIASARLGLLGWHHMRMGSNEEAVESLDKALVLASTIDTEEARDLALELRSLLALGHLQFAEDLNCLGFHNSASCILPMAREGVHQLPEHAKVAGDLLLQVGEARPEDVTVRWLLNVARIVSGDYPKGVPEALRLPADSMLTADAPRAWVNIAPVLGMHIIDLSGGAVMDDLDGDGFLDLVTSTSDPCGPMKALRNDGAGGFLDVTAEWGLDGQLGGLNLVSTDYDNDGAVDLLVLRGGWWGRDGRMRNSLLKNEIRGEKASFVDVTVAAGLAFPAYPTQTGAWADYDGDGDLDLYIGNESEGTAVYTADDFYRQMGTSYPSQFFRNNGDGTFTDIARQAGVDDYSYTKAVAWGDYDNDGDADLYVSNIGTNRLYRNKGDGSFEDVAVAAGVTEPQGMSFPAWFFDYDNDGWLDLLVTDYSVDMDVVFRSYLGFPTSSGQALLYHNTGDGRFEEVSREIGIRRPILPMGANFGDLDNDGWLDIFLSTGLPDFESLMPNAVYRNEEGGGFREVTFEWGFGHIQKGHGVAFGDLDHDGDQDILHQMGGAYPFDGYANALYENPGYGQHWIVLRLEGVEANRPAIGARLTVIVRQADRSRKIYIVAGTGGSFGASSLQQEIGLGEAQAIESIEVLWPGSGKAQSFGSVEMDRAYSLQEGRPDLVPLDYPEVSLASARLPAGAAHHHPPDQPR
ncbi:MAG: CRTAC1 family protein [Thermoanaerobaculia bacterium]